MASRVPIMSPHLRQLRHPRKEAQLRFQHEAVEAREAGQPLAAAQIVAVRAFDWRALGWIRRTERSQAALVARTRTGPTRATPGAARLEVLFIRKRRSRSANYPRRRVRMRATHRRVARRQRARSRSPGRQAGPSDADGPSPEPWVSLARGFAVRRRTGCVASLFNELRHSAHSDRFRAAG
jgi:hypothetical protein